MTHEHDAAYRLDRAAQLLRRLREVDDQTENLRQEREHLLRELEAHPEAAAAMLHAQRAAAEVVAKTEDDDSAT